MPTKAKAQATGGWRQLRKPAAPWRSTSPPLARKATPKLSYNSSNGGNGAARRVSSASADQQAMAMMPMAVARAVAPGLAVSEKEVIWAPPAGSWGATIAGRRHSVFGPAYQNLYRSCRSALLAAISCRGDAQLPLQRPGQRALIDMSRQMRDLGDGLRGCVDPDDRDE